ncbi:MAG: hypothetical protein D6766_07685 [Verrucomicrobia bacterium]|nr:MAG: hypothetical protein D6766_07685 [Verrucomicrobiota bacterium]
MQAQTSGNTGRLTGLFRLGEPQGARRAVRASGLDWTIFRPSLIFGPGDQFVNRFARMGCWSPFPPSPTAVTAPCNRSPSKSLPPPSPSP